MRYPKKTMGFCRQFVDGAFLTKVVAARVVFGSLLLAGLISSPLQAFDNCPFLIATALTETGGASLALGKRGTLNFIEDFFDPADQVPKWNHKVSTTALPFSSLISIKNADVLTDTDPHDGVWFLTQGVDGAVHWINPQGFGYGVRVQSLGNPTAASFYRPDLYFSYSPQDVAALSKNPFGAKFHVDNNVVHPGELWLALDKDIYRAHFKIRPIGDLGAQLNDARWPLRLSLKAFQQMNGQWAADETQGELTLEVGQDHVYWLPTSDASSVLEIQGLEKMATATTRRSIDYIRVLTPHKFVVANEIGEVEVWDHAVGRKVVSPEFSEAVWITSFSAFALKGSLEVWALNHDGKAVFRWQSSQERDFKRVPETELPMANGSFTALSASSQILPEISGFQRPLPPAWVRYPIAGGLPLRLNRILLATSDGQIHGASENAAIDFRPRFNQPPRWISYQVADDETGD